MPMPQEMSELSMSRVAAAGAHSHEHFMQFGKMLDFSFEQDRKIVSLAQGLGVREVASRTPSMGQVADTGGSDII